MGTALQRGASSALVALALVAGACVPAERSEVREVDPLAPPTEVPPASLEVGALSADELVVVLAEDLGRRPAELDAWAPSRSEASCAAARIVGSVGVERLDALGYRPGTPGSALGDLAFDAQEQADVRAAFVDCVDAREAFARIVVGRGRVAPRVATCMADGLERTGQLEVVVAAAALGEPLDPFADGGELARALSTQAGICVPEQAFNWPSLRLPEREPVLDLTAPAGTPGSRFRDDLTTTTTTTTEPAP